MAPNSVIIPAVGSPDGCPALGLAALRTAPIRQELPRPVSGFRAWPPPPSGKAERLAGQPVEIEPLELMRSPCIHPPPVRSGTTYRGAGAGGMSHPAGIRALAGGGARHGAEGNTTAGRLRRVERELR